jgi:hypothetical protein
MGTVHSLERMFKKRIEQECKEIVKDSHKSDAMRAFSSSSEAMKP